MLEFFIYNYFDDLTKLFSDVYLTKFLDILQQNFSFGRDKILQHVKI